MVERVKVHVGLLNENVEVWRPTSAFRLDGDLLVLSNENYDPMTEEWSVTPGSLIRIEPRVTDEGSIGVAIKHGESAR